MKIPRRRSRLPRTDADGNPLTYIPVTQPAHGTLSTGTGATRTYTPAANYNQADSFTFKVTDGQADSNIATVTFVIQPVNDQPAADSKPLLLDEDTPASVILSGSDVDGDALTFTVTTQPTHGTLTPPTGANRTYTPNKDYNGPDSFTYVAFDGSLTSSAATVTITVRPINDPPAALNNSYSVNEGSTVAITLTGTDVDSSSLTFTKLSSPSNGTLTGTAPNFTYRPNANFNGNDSFTFNVSDGQLTSTPGTITIHVTNLNFPPTANSAPVGTNEDTPATFTLTASDPDGDVLTFSVVTPPQHGTVGSPTSLTNTTAKIVYTPDLNYNGPDSFTFKVRDTALADSNVATMMIDVHAVNDAPVANDQSVQTDEDVQVAIALTGSDVENSALTYSIVTPPSNGTLSVITPGPNNSGSVTYTPNPNYYGPDSFTFKAYDGGLYSLPATVSLTVKPVNDAPVATPQSQTTAEDTPLTITLAGTDIDSPTLTFSVVATAQHGTLSGVTPGAGNTGTLTYTPALNYNGPDSFTFKANDGDLDSLPATVTLNVTPVNDAPVITLLPADRARPRRERELHAACQRRRW